MGWESVLDAEESRIVRNYLVGMEKIFTSINGFIEIDVNVVVAFP